MKNSLAGLLALGTIMVGFLSTPSQSQIAASPATAPDIRATPAQKLVGDVAPKLAELTDNVLFGDVGLGPNFLRGTGV
jgi:4-carboxymuconolactone decarboxylase